MDSNLYSIAYVSRNTIEEAGGDVGLEVGRILIAARNGNRQASVTGALLYSGGCFAQVLEGPLGAVEAVFERIQCDPRHADVTVLHFKPIESRCFGHWSMAFAGDPADGGAPPLPGLLAPTMAGVTEAGEDLVAVLRDLIARNDAG